MIRTPVVRMPGQGVVGPLVVRFVILTRGLAATELCGRWTHRTGNGVPVPDGQCFVRCVGASREAARSGSSACGER